MSEKELLGALLKELREARIPVDVDLWDTERIAAYLKRSHGTVRDRIIVQPSFPRPISIPPAENPRPLFKAREVIQWAESHQLQA